MLRHCRHCQSEFEVTDDDLALLEKLSPAFGEKKELIPPPLLCPNCRQQRRMSFRNERHLYRRKCDVTGKDIVSVFSPDNPYKVCEKNHWYSDAFDALSYGREYEAGVPFFAQFQKLALETPLPSLRIENSENCEFNNDLSDSKDCYMCARTHQCQDMLYTYRGNTSNDCADCMQVTKCAYLYECVECQQCQDSRYLFFCTECSSSAFLLDCRSCTDCFMCCNLRNKHHCFLNEQLTKEQYEAKLKEFDFGSAKMVQLAQRMYLDIRKKAIRRALLINNCENCTGDNLSGCKNCFGCFSAQKCTDSRYLWDVKLHHDSMDEYSGGRDSELMYETTSGSGSYGTAWCVRASDSQNVLYSFYISNCKNLFGCVGLQRKQYCILNKEYAKEEYEKHVPKIIAQMKKDGEYGEFFPATLSPFAYNETAAQEYFPLDEAQAADLGYRWQAGDTRRRGERSVDILDTIDDVTDDITKQVLCCEECQAHYKIVPQELSLYRERRIPIPRMCSDCRYMTRLQTKNPPVLRESTCQNCSKKIETSFPADAPERVYCEECYLKEVY
ncbi:hypothetical protein HZA87_02765 [Candidatus Uhrbacteria bacterium]|nr:hypothetical protein [Candidatus Uhrbacteria bacterium]